MGGSCDRDWRRDGNRTRPDYIVRNQSLSCLVETTFFNIRRKKVKTSFLLPRANVNETYRGESGIWKVRKVNLNEYGRREDNSILSFNPISPSLEYLDTPVVDVPYDVLFTRPSPISTSLSFSVFFRFFFFRSFYAAPSTCSSSLKVHSGNIRSRGTEQWSSFSVRNSDLSRQYLMCDYTCARPFPLLQRFFWLESGNEFSRWIAGNANARHNITLYRKLAICVYS